jgi:hypothetical protein
MAVTQTVAFEILATVEKYRAGLAQMEGITQQAAAKAALKLERELVRAQVNAAKAAEKTAIAAVKGTKEAELSVRDWNTQLLRATISSKKAGEEAGDLGDAAGEAGSNIGKLAGALDLVAPGLGSVAQAGADAFDVLEVGGEIASKTGLAMSVVGGAMVALAAAAAPLAGHLMVLAREEQEAAAQAAFLTDHLHDLDDAARGLEDAVLGAAVATGKLSKEEAELLAIRDQATRSIEDFRIAQEDERKAAEESFFANQRTLTRLEMFPDVLATAIDYYGGFSSAQAEAGLVLERLDGIEQEHQEIVVATAEALEEETKATQASTAARADAAAETLSFDEQVAALREKLAGEELDRQRMLREARDQDANEGLALLAKVEAEQIASAERVTEARIKEAERAAAEQQRLDALQIQSTANLFGSIADIAGTASEGLTDKQQDAQLALFTAQQIAAGAQAGVNAALGISQAAASAPPPYNIPPILAATAQGAAAVAAVAAVPAPAFNDTPMVLQNEGAGRQTVSLGSGDYYAAARTREDLEKQVLGPRAAAPASAPYTLAPSGRVFGETVQAAARLNTPLRRELRAVSSNTPGFRS